MRYRRQDPLRYIFPNPIGARFKIIQVGDRPVDSSFGKAVIHDLSTGGLKMATDIKIPLHKEIDVFLQLEFEGTSLSFTADVVWMKPYMKEYLYGLDFKGDQKSEIVQALKKWKAIPANG
ncbi:PilZ domain-containing protein [Halobacillus sp. ACCC02827]|uniref:PilZ domain-containing protein n=1 Tax=Bacillaceae TaxID=186817 RepID=UPI0002A4F01F|nr:MULTISPECIES: PilZ domain-containing protein [Bacillaceae]ELK48880.1 hypothetical protein D479_01255 [Halobacillus sp. BAB-2008]QHT45790.1 PilZ domain-containing protein [Bacillus sp. SB49]WJE16592.1 PilZ domain-containing protein [Halobacillus sp. ACCC02827]